MLSKIKYHFSAEVWQHAAPGGWYFVSLPLEMSKEIREHLQWQEEGWGRLKASAQIKDAQWDTAIWFDTKRSTYLLPLKADIRKKERIIIGQMIDILLWI